MFSWIGMRKQCLLQMEVPINCRDLKEMMDGSSVTVTVSLPPYLPAVNLKATKT